MCIWSTLISIIWFEYHKNFWQSRGDISLLFDKREACGVTVLRKSWHRDSRFLTPDWNLWSGCHFPRASTTMKEEAKTWMYFCQTVEFVICQFLYGIFIMCVCVCVCAWVWSMLRDTLYSLCSNPSPGTLGLTSCEAHSLWAALIAAFTGLLPSWAVAKCIFTKNKDFHSASQIHNSISKHKNKRNEQLGD